MVQRLMAFLTRIDPTRNIDRFYIVDITPTLFGEWALVREWGRRGSPGTMRLSSYQRRNEAETAEQRTIKRRLQHGYRIRPAATRGREGLKQPYVVFELGIDRFEFAID
jgi:predicted DNA-binding WGR domain protein